jgi:phosphoribosylformylglycinamidine (FGAM) synthase-like enzyme
MIYPGDTHVFSLALGSGSSGDTAVMVTPRITVLDALSGAVLVSAAAMNLIAGTAQVYTYAWTTTGIPEGAYFAVVSYATASATVNNRFLEAVRLGDSRVTGPVALDATVAKDATVAHDAAVLKLSDYTPAGRDAVVQAIKARTDLLPNDPASLSALTAIATALNDVRDFALGSWVNDMVNHTLTLRRVDGSVLAVFTVTNDGHISARTR